MEGGMRRFRCQMSEMGLIPLPAVIEAVLQAV